GLAAADYLAHAREGVSRRPGDDSHDGLGVARTDPGRRVPALLVEQDDEAGGAGGPEAPDRVVDQGHTADGDEGLRGAPSRLAETLAFASRDDGPVVDAGRRHRRSSS